MIFIKKNKDMKNIRKFDDLQSFKEVYGKEENGYLEPWVSLTKGRYPKKVRLQCVAYASDFGMEYAGEEDGFYRWSSFAIDEQPGYDHYYTRNRIPAIGEDVYPRTGTGAPSLGTVTEIMEYEDGVDYNYNGFVFDLAQMRTTDTSYLISSYQYSFKMLYHDRKLVTLYDQNPFEQYDDLYEYTFDERKSKLRDMDLTFKVRLVNYKTFDPSSQEDELELTFTSGGSGSGWYSYNALNGNKLFMMYFLTWPWGITPREGEWGFFLTYENHS